MFNIKFEVKRTGILAMPIGAAGALFVSNSVRALNGVMRPAKDAMVAAIPFKRHAAGNKRPHLRDQIKFERATAANLSARIVVKSEIFQFFEEGTAPHIIHPRGGKAVSFYDGGERVTVAYVRHPGTKAHHVAQKAQRKIETQLPKALARAAAATIRGARLP